MADAYTDAQEEDADSPGIKPPPFERRYNIMREALKRMGASVLSGALTTVMASSMLIFTTIRIFFRFGVVVSVNMSVSVVLSLFLFSAIMMLFGPVGHTGDLFFLLRCIFGKCFPRFCAKKNAHSIYEEEYEMKATSLDLGSRSAEVGLDDPSSEPVSAAGDDADAELQ
jgi:hypothetical protein